MLDDGQNTRGGHPQILVLVAFQRVATNTGNDGMGNVMTDVRIGSMYVRSRFCLEAGG